MPSVESLFGSDNPKETAVEMDSLFAEHAIEEDTGPSLEIGDALFTDFKTLSKTRDGTIPLVLYFHLPNDTVGSYTEYIHPDLTNSTDFIQTLVDKMGYDNHISEALGTRFEVQKYESEDEWRLSQFECVISKTVNEPSWDSSKRRRMEDKLASHLTNTSTPSQTSTTATIVDYYVRKSANNIQQDLEIGLKFKIETGEVTVYECIHDAETPDAGIERILSYFDNPESLSALLDETVPVVYNPELGNWELHLPRKDSLLSSMAHSIERLIRTHKTRRTITFGKQYGHSKNRDKTCWSDTRNTQSNGMNERIEELNTIERMGIV